MARSPQADDWPSRAARRRLQRRLSREIADLRVRLDEAILRADAHLLAGDESGARSALEDHGRLVAELRGRLEHVVAEAAVEREAEAVLAGVATAETEGAAEDGALDHAGRRLVGLVAAALLAVLATMPAIPGAGPDARSLAGSEGPELWQPDVLATLSAEDPTAPLTAAEDQPDPSVDPPLPTSRPSPTGTATSGLVLPGENGDPLDELVLHDLVGKLLGTDEPEVSPLLPETPTIVPSLPDALVDPDRDGDEDESFGSWGDRDEDADAAEGTETTESTDTDRDGDTGTETDPFTTPDDEDAPATGPSPSPSPSPTPSETETDDGDGDSEIFPDDSLGSGLS